MFGNMVVGIGVLYGCYYLGMIGFDLYRISKAENEGNNVETIDISGVTDNYKPIDVRSLLGDEDNDTQIDSEESSPEEKAAESVTPVPDNIGGEGEHITKTFQEGYSAKRMKEIFVENSAKPSLFAKVKFVN